MAWKLVLMHNVVVIYKIFLIVVSVGCVAGTIYTVGDSSGWDISTDLDSWVQAKAFLVGDSLLFQFPSYHSLVELPREEFETCNTTKPPPQQAGNTTIPLTRPGDRFFSCGNSLHCLGGMKLQVHVVSNQTSTLQPTSSLRGPSLPNIPPSSASGLLFKQGTYTSHCCWMVLLIAFSGCLIF